MYAPEVMQLQILPCLQGELDVLGQVRAKR